MCEVKGVDLKSNLAIKSAGGLSSAESELGGAEVIKINPNPT